MKHLIFIFLATLLASCASRQNVQIKETGPGEEEDSVSYELIVLDPGFESWFITNSKPSWYHSQDYYENWNQRYVQAWNYHSMGSRYSQLIEGNIDYDPKVDYGLEINHKLFYYFQYVTHVLKIPIITDGPRTF